MRRLIWILIVLIISVYLGLLIAKDPGIALFSYGHWSLEMPLWFAIVCFIIIIACIYCLIGFFSGVDKVLYRFKNWRSLKRKDKAYSKTTQGVRALLEGQWKHAEYYLTAGLTEPITPLINYLGLALAAHEQHAYDRRDKYIQKAKARSKDSAVGLDIMQARMLIDEGNREKATVTLNLVRNIIPRHPYVLKLLERIYVREGNFQQLLALLPSLYRASAIRREQFYFLEKRCYQELMRLTCFKSHSLQMTQDFWKTIPRKLKKDPIIIYYYVQKLNTSPEAIDEAYELINQVLKRHWDENLVRYYGLLNTSYVSKQLAHAEDWNRKYPEQPVLLLTLGRLALKCQLWGKARSYLVDSLKLSKIPEAYIEYGKLLEQLGDTDGALQSYREGLELSCNHLPRVL